MHAYIHAYIHTYLLACIHTYKPFSKNCHTYTHIHFDELTLQKNTSGDSKNPSMSVIEHFMTIVNYCPKGLHLRCCTDPKFASEYTTV